MMRTVVTQYAEHNAEQISRVPQPGENKDAASERSHQKPTISEL